MAMQGNNRSDTECSIFVGNLDSSASEEILWELFLQAGPIKSIHIPCDKDTGKQKQFAFVEFYSSVAAHYAWELFDGIRLYNRSLTVRPRNSEKTDTPRYMPSNVIPASDFYQDFYHKYEEWKHRPQSEPRRNQWTEESNSQRNNSFSQPSFNRSFSSASNFPNHVTQQLMNMRTGGRNNSTPYRNSPSPLRIPKWGSSPYGRSPSNSGSHSSPTPYRGSMHGYTSPNQDQYGGNYWR
ncbi:RNA-binding protein 7-like [Dendronephthya gigantea]|uniref:RNA-binding protein 7-like n=1 Tax=Dendronephthya gigantea TaxID=151771 RepID=UPI00106D1299|nr:RNA-binding protein 7-like [Dendronephthya gigantea]